MSVPRLRHDLELMPSPVAERPGLLIRDPYRYSSTVLILPPPLIPALLCFDGARDEPERAALLTGLGPEAARVVEQLADALGEAGFLDDEGFARLKAERVRAFAEAPRRDPAHAGSAYPAEAGALRDTLLRYLDGAPAAAGTADDLLGIAAPHVSPEGGWQSYRAAYTNLGPQHRHRTCVVLGTSHYGEAERFGLTRKPFVTPLGQAQPDLALVDWLAQRGGPAVVREDYCHAVEHSVEFQVVFLQQLLGAGVRILPVLCGPFARATREGGRPEADPGVARFLDALGELAAREAGRLLWVLGVDMAHVGRRYGDAFAARADQGALAPVAERDRERIGRLTAGDAPGFWDLVAKGGDALRWCGASPLYTFLRAVAPARGQLLRYEQWNIDPESVVSFAGLSFSARAT